MRKIFRATLMMILMTSACRADTVNEVNNGISAVSIINNINKGKAVLVQGKIITDDLDFTDIKRIEVFSSSLKIARIEVPVTFINCIFMGKVTTNAMKENILINAHFRNSVTFEACDFRKDADFSNSTVEGMANFTGAVFRENALFNNVTFKGRHTYFTAFTSEKLFSMQEAKIEGAVDFFKGKVSGKFTFQSTDFGGIARFSDLDCNGKSDFSLTNFRSDALFTYANFVSDFRFSDARVAGKTDLISVSFHTGAWLTNSVFTGTVNLTKSEAKSIFDLSGSLFIQGKPVMDEFVVMTPEQVITSGTRYVLNTEFETDNILIK